MAAHYVLELTQGAERQLNRIHGKDKGRIEEAIGELADKRRGTNIQKLKPSHRSLYRKRLGNFRIVFNIDDKNKMVTVTQIGDRKDIYD